MKKLFSHITAAMCALFVSACFAICANAAQAAFNVSFNSDMAVGKSYMIGSFLVVILAFIGIMNFFNTTATSVISRKKELALLEVVGMTKKQVSKMLVTEGFLYLGGAFVIAVLLVVFGAEKILANTLGTAFFFQMHLTIVPCLLMVPILSGIAYAIPKYQFKKMSQESVVERIRKE